MSAVSEAEETRAVQRTPIVVNGLATLPYPPGCELGSWTGHQMVQAMAEGGVTAANVTLAVEEDFATAAIRVGRAVKIYGSEVDGACVVRTVGDLETAASTKSAGLILGFQNITALEGDFDKLDLFRWLGVRIIQLTYQRRNIAADGCGEPGDGGLSTWGRELVRHMNALGILIDLSHTGRRSSLDAIEESNCPVVFSHANVGALAPHPRNKTDCQIRLLAERGGVMGITAIGRFLSPETGRATVEDLLNHIDYVVELVGIDHVGIGLDITEGLTKDVFDREKRPLLDAYPELEGPLSFDNYYADPVRSMAKVDSIRGGLAERGYDEEAVRKVMGENFVRVFGQVWVDG